MPEDYTVQQGDCMSSIAYERGFYWKTLWDDSNNVGLKSERKNPNILKEGDVVHVPDLRPKEESGATEKRHRFRRKGVPETLNIIVKRLDEPRANESYVIEIDGVVKEGTTDGKGRVKHSIPPNARQGSLRIGKPPEVQVFRLNLGHIDPITELSGIQGRLNNLSFHCGEASGQMNPATEAALRAFQARFGLKETGEPDSATRDRLKQEHGS